MKTYRLNIQTTGTTNFTYQVIIMATFKVNVDDIPGRGAGSKWITITGCDYYEEARLQAERITGGKAHTVLKVTTEVYYHLENNND